MYRFSARKFLIFCLFQTTFEVKYVVNFLLEIEENFHSPNGEQWCFLQFIFYGHSPVLIPIR